MGSSKAPKPADTKGAAQAEAQGNKEVAQYTGALDRPTQIDPYGTLTWEYAPKPGSEQTKSLDAGQNSRIAALGNTVSKYGPNSARGRQAQAEIASIRANPAGSASGSIDNPRPGDWIQRLTLTPEQQAILNAEQANDLSLQQLASQGVDIAKGTLGSRFNPQLQGLGSLGGLGKSLYSIPGMGQSSINLSSLGLGQGEVGTPENRLNQLAMLQEDPNMFSADRQKVVDSMYEQMTRFSGERFGREEESERTRLANTGLMPGSEAYNRALSEFRRSKDESYRGAELQSILAGGAEQSRMLQDLLGTRASNIGLGQAQFGQDAARNQMDLAERQAQQAAQAQMYGMGLDERQAQFGAGVNRYQLGLGERQSQQQSQMNQLNWDAQRRQQQFQEAAYNRALPLNEITALMGGSGVNLPQFQPFNQQNSWQGPALMDAELARHGQEVNATNADNAKRGQTTAAIGTVAMIAAYAY